MPPFNVRLDIAVEFPALLVVPYLEWARLRRISFKNYAAMGAMVQDHFTAPGECEEIGVSQERTEDDP